MQTPLSEAAPLNDTVPEANSAWSIIGRRKRLPSQPAKLRMNNPRLVVIDGFRTPFCKAGTELAAVSADELGRIAVDARTFEGTSWQVVAENLPTIWGVQAVEVD